MRGGEHLATCPGFTEMNMYFQYVSVNKCFVTLWIKIIRSYALPGLHINPTQIIVAEIIDIGMLKDSDNKLGKLLKD